MALQSYEREGKVRTGNERIFTGAARDVKVVSRKLRKELGRLEGRKRYQVEKAWADLSRRKKGRRF